MAFFEQLGKKISDVGQGASQQAKNFAEITRLNGMISDNEKWISQIYAEIGKSYFDRHKNDPQSEENDRISEINSRLSEIEQCQEKIKQIKGVAKCPNCGADIPANTSFCSSCGTKIEAEKKPEGESAQEPKLCPQCKNPVIEGNLFCNHCGKKLG